MPSTAKMRAKNPGRKRRALGWMLLTLGLLVAGVCVASWYMELVWRTTTGGTGLWRGRAVVVGTDELPLAVGASVVDLVDDAEWIARSGRNGRVLHDRWFFRSVGASLSCFGPHVWVESAPLWPLAAVPMGLGSSVVGWGWAAGSGGAPSRRRVLKGMCGACGYNLAGLASNAPCPECGKEAKATT